MGLVRRSMTIDTDNYPNESRALVATNDGNVALGAV